MIDVFRWLYFFLVAVGLLVNFGELRAAQTVYANLVAAQINSSRLVLASHFVRKGVMLTGIQVFLMITSIISLYLPIPVPRGPKLLSSYSTLILVSVLAHMAAVLMLMLMAIMSWYDRNLVMNMLSANARKHEQQELALEVIRQEQVATRTQQDETRGRQGAVEDQQETTRLAQVEAAKES